MNLFLFSFTLQTGSWRVVVPSILRKATCTGEKTANIPKCWNPKQFKSQWICHNLPKGSVDRVMCVFLLVRRSTTCGQKLTKSFQTSLFRLCVCLFYVFLRQSHTSDAHSLVSLFCKTNLPVCLCRNTWWKSLFPFLPYKSLNCELQSFWRLHLRCCNTVVVLYFVLCRDTAHCAAVMSSSSFIWFCPLPPLLPLQTDIQSHSFCFCCSLPSSLHCKGWSSFTPPVISSFS